MADKKSNPLIGAFRAPVPDKDKDTTAPPLAAPDPKDTGTAPAKAAAEKKPTEPPKDTPDPKGTNSGPAKDDVEKKDAEPARESKFRFVKISEIVPLPGTYIKDTPRNDYTALMNSIRASGLEKPVILRQGEKGEYQLVDGFHRCEALKRNGALEVRADVYEMPLTEASRYRKEHRNTPDLPIPGKLLPYPPPAPEKPVEPDKAMEDEEIPKDFKLPITKEGQAEIITTLKVDDIHPFDGHPFIVKDDKDMWDLVESMKKFGILEPVVVVPRQKGGYG